MKDLKCKGCSYKLNEKDNQLNCSKYIDDDNQLCDLTNLDNLKNCKEKLCDDECMYPFPKGFYKSDNDNILNEYYDSNKNSIHDQFNYQKINYTDYYDYVTDNGNLEYKGSYSNDNPPLDIYDKFKCGTLPTSVNNTMIPFPKPPNKKQLDSSIKYMEKIHKKGIDWNTITLTPKFIKNFQIKYDPTQILIPNTEKGELRLNYYYTRNNSIVINGNEIFFSNNGLEMEWWNTIDEENDIKSLVHEKYRDLIDINDIHSQTGQIIGKEIGLLRPVKEEVLDYIKVKGYDMVHYNVSFVELFDFMNDDISQECIQHLTIKDEENDFILDKLNELYESKQFSKLGNKENNFILDYIDKNLNEILSIPNDQFLNCIQSDKYCKNGLFDFLKIIEFFKNIGNTIDFTDNDSLRNYNKMIHKFQKYIPLFVKKMIEISVNYEEKYCQKQKSINTILMEKFLLSYQLLNQNNQKNITDPTMNTMDLSDIYKIPDININYFDDLNQNIVTKIILLLILAYLFAQILSLFKINYNINTTTKD